MSQTPHQFEKKDYPLDSGFSLRKLYQLFERKFPETITFYIIHRILRRRYHAYMQRTLGEHYVRVDPGPAPPKELIQYTSALDQKALKRECSPDKYFLGGYRRLLDWLLVLEHFSFRLRTTKAILEFGHGTARLLRHFSGFKGIRLVGTDANPKCVEWCQQNISGMEFYCNKLDPPLLFAENNAFDLILASSVFTHIPIDKQQSWLEEIKRILMPGGYFLCTVLGPKHQSAMLGNSEMIQLNKAGHVTFKSDDPRASLSTQVKGSLWDVFQKRDEILKAFENHFTILDFIPGAQDLLVLYKPSPTLQPNIKPFPFCGLF